MRVLAKLADYSEFLQRHAAVRSETHPQVDLARVREVVQRVAAKGRRTLTEPEGYDVGAEAAWEAGAHGVSDPHAGLSAGHARAGGCGLRGAQPVAAGGQVRGEDRVAGCKGEEGMLARSSIRATWVESSWG